MPDTLTVYTNQPRHGGGNKKLKRSNRSSGNLVIDVNFLVVRSNSGSSLTFGREIRFTGSDNANLTKVILGSMVCGKDLVIGFYYYLTNNFDEETPVRILGIGDLVVTVDTTTGTQETGTDTGVSESP